MRFNTVVFGILVCHLILPSLALNGVSDTEATKPVWTQDIRGTLGAGVVGVISGANGHEYELLPRRSLQFTDNDTLVTTVVTREGKRHPELSRNRGSEESSNLRLRAVFLDAAS